MKPVTFSFQLQDPEGAVKADANAIEASGIDLSSLSVLLRNSKVWEIDITSRLGAPTILKGAQDQPTLVQFSFVPSPGEIDATNQVVIHVKDLAGNPIDPSPTVLDYDALGK